MYLWRVFPRRPFPFLSRVTKSSVHSPGYEGTARMRTQHAHHTRTRDRRIRSFLSTNTPRACFLRLKYLPYIRTRGSTLKILRTRPERSNHLGNFWRTRQGYSSFGNSLQWRRKQLQIGRLELDAQTSSVITVRESLLDFHSDIFFLHVYCRSLFREGVDDWLLSIYRKDN